MASEQIPVTADVVTWARERAGYDLAEAAKKFARIADWEAGEAGPTYAQLESMAEVFKIPVAAFFFPERPKLPPIKESFRTLPDTAFDEIPRPVRFLMQKGKALQLNLAELTQGKNPAPRLITRELVFAEDTTADALAAGVRAYLNVSTDEQTTWADDDAALKMWRAALQQVGVFVFKDAFRADNYCGFSLYDEEFPIIYVNNTATKTRQIFTLFHELAHIIFHTSGIDTLNDDYIDDLASHKKRIEVLCNRFAAQFLLPDDVLDAAVVALPFTEATAELIASRFHVSREVVYRKFLDRSWIRQSEYLEAAQRWSDQRKKAGSGGDYYWNQIAYLGREYLSLAFTAYNRNRIDETQLADYLNIKPKNLAKLEEYFAGSKP